MNFEDEVRWLIDNPHFIERPASITEFLGPDYLNIRSKTRPGIVKALVDVFGETVDGQYIGEVERAIITGAIGIGKTTFASIAIPYMVHWVLCLRDPQGFYNLLPGSRIAFMQMSTSEDQARQVIFGDIEARIAHSSWFKKHQPDGKFTKSIRFEKNIWILPGDSAETTFEGYNILGGILDEADSHKVTKEKDYARQGYDTIESRIKSRFVDNSNPDREGHRGLIIVIGQMKKATGFAAEIYKDMLDDPHAHTTRMTIWESFGWSKYLDKDGKRNSFWYDIERKEILPDGLGKLLTGASTENDKLIEIPNAFRSDFMRNPQKSLRDLAGIPPEVNDPFISMTYKITAAQDRFEESYPGWIPVSGSCSAPVLNPPAQVDSRKRVAHIDIGVSSEGDAAGIAVGYVRELVESPEGDMRPFIVIEYAIRVKASSGTEVILSDLRRYIFELKEAGYRIDKVTLDGFQSTDTMQIFRKHRIRVDYLSLDRSKLGYEDLREAIYEDRIEFPRYMTPLSLAQPEEVDIITQELMGLSDTGPKIDHPKNGSKDVADAIAGVVQTLMNDNTYRKGIVSGGRRGSNQKSLEELLSSTGRSTSLGASIPTQLNPVLDSLLGTVPQMPARLRNRNT